jgi:quinol-cytochrome oxidoreductase complex cytochrome b subunit
MVIKFLTHLRPKYIDENALKFSTTFGLGGLLTLLFFILTVTGIVLMFFYIPTTREAYISIKKISNIIPLTGFFRDIHRISGELMIVVALLHMLRIVYFKAFDNRFRVLNWLTGILLFLLIFPLNFTGYLLPWDNISYWGATIVLNIVDSIPFVGEKLRFIIAGGKTLNSATLIRFYTYHVVVLPIVCLFLMMNHFYLIRAAKGVKTNVSGNISKVKARELFKTEIIYSLIIVILIITVCSFFYNAPLLENANSAIIPPKIKAPWYFASLQYLLTYLPPLVAGVAIPFLYTLFMLFFYKIQSFKLFLFVHFLFILFTILEIFVR